MYAAPFRRVRGTPVRASGGVESCVCGGGAVVGGLTTDAGAVTSVDSCGAVGGDVGKGKDAKADEHPQRQKRENETHRQCPDE